MENRPKLKISRMFRSSLGSCRSKNISDVVKQPFFYPQIPHHHQLFSPNAKPPPPFPSMCRPKCLQTPKTEKNINLFPRSKLTDRSPLFPFQAEKNGRNCPPASPISPPSTTSNPKQRKSRKTRKKKSQLKKNKKIDEFFGSESGNYYGWWYSSSEDEDEDKDDDDDDQTTFFSSKSDSSESFRRNRAHNRQGRIKNEESEKGLIPLEGKVKDSFAVVKRSSDPYNDFRTSMVEMIVERQLFGSEDLENLLQCFLSLNSISHHRVIIEVFIEIWETLFSEWA